MSFTSWMAGREPPDPKNNQGGGALTDWMQGAGSPSEQRLPVQPEGPITIPEIEKALPQGAESWDPNGNPYFGEGIPGILKKWQYNFTKDVKQVDDSEWLDLKSRWEQSMNETTNDFQSRLGVELEQIGMVGEAIGKAWQAGTADNSILSPILKATGATVTSVGELFSIPAQLVEQSLGAVEAASLAINDILHENYDEDVVTQMIREGKLNNTATAATLAFSPSSNKWEYAKQKIEEGWQSGRIFYSTVFDETKKEEFLREYRAGGDPALIAMKLANPWAELGGQLILDPLNLVGAFGKAAKSAKEIAAADAATTASGLLKTEAGKAALKAMQEATDEISGVRALHQLEAAHSDAVKAVQSGSKLLNVSYGADALTTTSRQNAVISKGKTLLGNMALVLQQSGLNADGVAEAVLAGVRSVSGNADEMRNGLAALSKLPNANMWLGDDYLETFTVLNRFMSSADGVVDGGRLRKLMEISSPAQFADEAVKLMRSAASDQFKSVAEMAEAATVARKAERAGEAITDATRALADQYNSLPPHVKYLDKVDRALSVVRNPINKVLGLAYFNLQGGVAFRNIITNQELILIDKGVGAFFREGKYWSTQNVADYITDIYKELPSFAKGFETMAQAATDSRSAFGFGKWMEKGEEAAAVRVVGAAIRDTIDKMLPKAMPNLAAAVEAGHISQAQANKLTQLIRKNPGNLPKALEDFRAFYKAGAVENWRNLDFVTPFQRQALESMDLWRDIEDLAHNGASSLEDVQKVFDKARKVIDDRAAMAADDVTGLSVDHPGAESWARIMEAVEQGHLDPSQQHVFTALMESAEHVRLEYQDLLDGVALKAQQALQMEGRGQEAAKIGEEMNRIRSALRRSGPATAREAKEVTDAAWTWTEQIKAVKKGKPEQYQSLWRQAGLAGDPPADLNGQLLLRELWKQRFQKVTQIWNTSLDAVVGESETVLKQLDGIVDTAEIEAAAGRARVITQQAQAIRSSTYDGKVLRYRQEDYLSIARKYGIPTAGKDGKPNDGALLNIVNKYSDMPETPPVNAKWKSSKGTLSTTLDGVKYEISKDGTLWKVGAGGSREVLGDYKNVEDARAAFSSGKAHIKETQSVTIGQEGFEGFEGGSPLQVLAKGGGLNADEFSDVAGGVLGHDKQGVMPGLFQKQGAGGKGMGIDEAGRLLADNGYISAEQAEDTNFVREFIRKQMDKKNKGAATYEEELRPVGAPYYDDEGKLQNVPKDWKFQSLDEVPTDVLKRALDNQRRAHGLDPIPVDPGIAIPPPHPIGSQPTIQRAWNENARGAKQVLDSLQKGITDRWGQITPGAVNTPEMESILSNVTQTVEPRLQEIKAVALRIAEQQRDFTLLNYGNKTYGDVAKAYFLPYHFFYSRSYPNWIKRIATDPEIVAGYGKYKENLESINKDLPDWYKQQLNINPLSDGKIFGQDVDVEGKTILGIPVDHPLFMNLESTFNPLYGLTGTDYFDKTKRHNWATATMDDLGKFGPSIWAPIQLGIAATLFKDGETEVASRWASRVFPETAQIKAASSLFGKPIELDPAVNFFNGGIDAQERGRMAYAAAQLIESGQFTPEEVQLSFQAQEGEAWDLSYQMAVQSRAFSSATSYFFGVGFKPRSENDVMVEEMYGKLNKLYAAADMMDPEKYRMAWEQLRSEYPDGFVDTVLLSRKGGDKRDAALAYEVLNRIPPGNMGDALATIGLSQKEIGKFYDSKGFTENATKDGKPIRWTNQEKDRFMSAVIDLATMLKIPDSATRAEWTEARTANGAVYDAIEEDLGADIWDKVSHWYDLKDDNKEAADAFAAQHPEIFQAQQMKREFIVNTPVLSAYYGGIETIEAYVDGKVRQALSDEFGGDIYDIQSGYFNAPDSRAYLAKHPELRKFWSRKKEIEAQAESMFYEFAERLPEARGAEFQEGFTPESYTQEELQSALQPQSQVPSWEEVSQGMAPWLQDEILQYAQTGKPISDKAKKQMDYLADVGNYYNAKELLRLSVLSMRSAPFDATGQGAGSPGGESFGQWLQGQ